MAYSRLADPAYERWLKVTQGLLKLKELIVPTTENVIDAFHASIVAGIAGLYVLPLCTCTHSNIDRRNQCMQPPCPRCDPPLGHIINASKQKRNIGAINLQNSIPAKWATDMWEVAKCYMGRGLKASNHGAADTDTSNILIMWNSCTKFDPLIANRNLLQAVLTVRNDAMHSPGMQCSQADMMARFVDIINLLNDTKLSPHLNTNAITSMEAIRDTPLVINADVEMVVWSDLINSHSNTLEELTSKSLNEPIADFLNNNPDLLSQLQRKVNLLGWEVSVLERRTDEQDKRLDSQQDVLSQVPPLQGRVAEQGQRLDSQQRVLSQVHGRVAKQDERLDSQQRVLSQVPQLQGRVVQQDQRLDSLTSRVDEHNQRMTLPQRKRKALDSQQVVADLREELCQTYLRTCRSVQPIPWVEKTLPLQDVFMEPTLKRNTESSLSQRQSDERSVGLADILQPLEPGTPSPRRVLVEGRPGSGKSTICQRLLSGWAEGVEASSPNLGVGSSARADAPSHAPTRPHTDTRSTTCTESHSQPTPATPSPSESFVGARPRRSGVQERVGFSPIGGFAIVLFLMVRNLIVGDLSDNLLCLLLRESWRSRQEELRACLGENCQQVLILLDGFDEAARPHKDLLIDILGEREMRGCTVIVTSRPGFCSSRVDATFQLQGFDHHTRVRYINRFVEVVKGAADHPCTAMLVHRLESPGIIGHLCQTPLFLVLVCVLGSQEGSALPDTHTQLYEQFVDFLQCQAVDRHGFQSDYMSSLQQTLQRIALTLLKDNTTEISLATVEQHSATQPSTPGPFTVKHDQPLTARADVTLRALCQVGFLIQNYKLKVFKEVASGSFIHQSFVDYFAAKGFITMSKEQRAAFIADHVSRKTMFHNVFVYVAGCCGREVLVELFDGWRRAVAARGAPSLRAVTPLGALRFDPSDPVREMDRMSDLTQASHALFHDAPFSWLAESADVCSASLALLTHGRLETVCLTRSCTESCVRGVRTLCKALSGPQASPVTRPLQLGLNHCNQIGAGVVLDVLEQVGLTHGAVDCVLLPVLGAGGYYGVPYWTVRDCESLAALPVWTRLKVIGLCVCEWEALDALSVSFTPTHALQQLIVLCGHHSYRSQHLTEFRRNVRCLSNIHWLVLRGRGVGAVSAEARRDLNDWGAGQDVKVEVERF